jgi:hypothetical protein
MRLAFVTNSAKKIAHQKTEKKRTSGDKTVFSKLGVRPVEVTRT